MDWSSLKNTYPRPALMNERCFNLTALQRVLAGSQYDQIIYDFSQERTDIGEYIPLRNRRPSVRTNLCRIVVDDAVSLLFGDTHFPLIAAEKDEVATQLTTIIRECCLEQIMIKVATEGSVGSSAVLLEVVEAKPKFTVLNTAYLTPVFAEDGCLVTVTEQRVLKGHELRDMGYAITEQDLPVWFVWRRVWDDTDTTMYVPQTVADYKDNKPMQKDEPRSRHHAFGFVPILWAANFGAAPGDTEGECTFLRAIDTVIEMDYLLSQNGRGLYYSCDPTLVLTDGGAGDDPLGAGGGHEGGSANVLCLPPNGDAKLLEINGKASGALNNHYRELRALVLEIMHGNRAHSDKIASAQSGRAMEMMSQSLVWLSDRMRQCYGPTLMALLRMLCSLSDIVEGGICVNNIRYESLDCTGMVLRWPPWFPPTDHELLALAQSLVTAVAGRIISNQTACTIYSARIGIEDGEREWKAIQEEIKTLPKLQPSDIVQSANDGPRETRHITA